MARTFVDGWAHRFCAALLLGVLAAVPRGGAATVNVRYISADVDPGKEIVAWNHHIVRFRKEGEAQAFSGVLFGSAPGVGANRVGRGYYNDSGIMEGGVNRPEWTTTAGYAVFRGWLPIIRTRIVRAVGEGSTIAIEIGVGADGKEIHRVYLIEGTAARIEILDGEQAGATFQITAGQFTAVSTKGEVVVEAKRIDDDGYAKGFVERTTIQAKYKEMVTEFPHNGPDWP